VWSNRRSTGGWTTQTQAPPQMVSRCGDGCVLPPTVVVVYRSRDPSQELLDLAARQAGVVAFKQFEQVDFQSGAGRRWKHDWTRMLRGIYCLHQPTWTSWCWAALLHAGPSSVVGGSAAAHLLGAVASPPVRILVWHGGTTAIEPIGDASNAVTFRRAERTGRGEPPRTPIDVTLLDLAAESTEEETVAAITSAFSRGLTKPSRLLALCSQRKQVSRRSLVVTLCGEASRGVESILEWRFLTKVVRGHHLPEPTLQATLASGTRSDAFWREHGLVIELDGRLGHEQAFRDMARDNRLAISGLQTLRYGWHDVTQRPCGVAQQLGEVLRSRGWTGAVKMCATCRTAPMG